MSELGRTVNKAQETFEGSLGGDRRELSRFYREIPIQLQRLPTQADTEIDEKSAVPTNPFIFLTDIWKTRPANQQEVGNPPFLSLVLGTYGTGKSELIYQLCRFTGGLGDDSDSSAEGREALCVLPINLGSCRRRQAMLKKEPSGEEFANLIFGDLKITSDYAMKHIAPSVCNGRTILALDGLDELASRPHHHRHFFTGLRKFIESASPCEKSLFWVVVTMRLEYLANVDAHFEDLSENFRSKSAWEKPVYLLMLDYFERSQIKHYLRLRLGSQVDLINHILDNRRLRDMVRRPLLLKIFGDLAAEEGIDIQSLLEVKAPASLIKLYVNLASEKTQASQEHLSTLIWDEAKLAQESVQLYRNSQSEMAVTDLEKVVVGGSLSSGRPAPDSKLSDEEAFLAVHKCPFLLRAGLDHIKFSHRVFLEYFTARGLVDGLLDSPSKRTDAIDDLVLDVDTRKFLRDMIDEDGLDFDTVTRRSYGLEDPDQWELEPPLQFRNVKWYEFEKLRLDLMYHMTDPEKPSGNIRKRIDKFMVMENDGLHPGYLTYNYESVAVYIMQRRWKKEGRDLGDDFGEIMKRRLKACISELDAGGFAHLEVKKDTERLVERILHIAQRLRFGWIRKKICKEDDIYDLISEEDTQSRIRDIISNIKESVF